MLKKFLFTLIVSLFSFKVFAIDSDDLFDRLGIDQEFLNSSQCTVKSVGAALAIDNASVPDSIFHSGKVKYLGQNHNYECDHGNNVARILSIFLPDGSTYLDEIPCVRSALLNNRLIHESLYSKTLLVVNLSIDHTLAPNEEYPLEDYYRQLSVLLTDMIIVLAAGNDGDDSGGSNSPLQHLIPKLIAMCTPEERKRIVYVGATQRRNNCEVLDSAYSNIAGQNRECFVLAPSSLKHLANRTLNGTSYAAPIVSGLLTRALLANPSLLLEDAVWLLFQTADKSTLLGTHDADIDATLYGHGVVKPRLFFRAARALDELREVGNTLDISLEELLPGFKPSSFLDYRGDLKRRLDIIGILNAYDDESAPGLNFSSHIDRIATEEPLDCGQIVAADITLDNFIDLADMFERQGLSEDLFAEVAFEKFSWTETNAEGSSLLTLAIYGEKNILAERLINNGFDITFRSSEDDVLGMLPIHAACFTGNRKIFDTLIQRGASIDESCELVSWNFRVDPLLATIVGAASNEKLEDRLHILEFLHRRGANYMQTHENISLVTIAITLLGEDSLITKFIQSNI